MNVLLDLFLTFFKIGLFSFGGGYAMIPVIQSEIVRHNWLTIPQFADIIAIAEMTPGPIAVNSATYVGYKMAGIIGGLIATAGVTMPSLLLVLLVAHFFQRFQNHPLNKMVFYGLRPVVVGLVFTAALVIGQNALIHLPAATTVTSWFSDLVSHPLLAIRPASLLIFALTLLLSRKSKIHPLILIGGAGASGMILFSLLPGWG